MWTKRTVQACEVYDIEDPAKPRTGDGFHSEDQSAGHPCAFLPHGVDTPFIVGSHLTPLPSLPERTGIIDDRFLSLLKKVLFRHLLKLGECQIREKFVYKTLFLFRDIKCFILTESISPQREL